MSETLAIASGKGGVGKTTISVNLALTQARSSSCLLLDADMGMANAHILLGINPKTSVKDVIDGKMSLDKAIVEGPNNIQFLSGGSGITELLSIDKTKKFNNYMDKCSETIVKVFGKDGIYYLGKYKGPNTSTLKSVTRLVHSEWHCRFCKERVNNMGKMIGKDGVFVCENEEGRSEVQEKINEKLVSFMEGNKNISACISNFLL